MIKRAVSKADIESDSEILFDAKDAPETARRVIESEPHFLEFWRRCVSQGPLSVLSGVGQFQPSVMGLLSTSGGFLGLFDGRKVHLCLDTGTSVVILHPFNRLSDPLGSGGKPRQIEKYRMFPPELRESYFHQFCGISILAMDDRENLMPWPILIRPREFWSPVDETLAAAGMKKSQLPKLFDMMPDIRPEDGSIVRGLWTVLSSDWPITGVGQNSWTLHFRSEDRPSSGYLMRGYEADSLVTVDDLLPRLDDYLSKKISEPLARLDF